jgi:hypothetical protein
MIELLLPCGFDTLKYSWVKATIGICTHTYYSVAKKCQHLAAKALGVGPTSTALSCHVPVGCGALLGDVKPPGMDICGGGDAVLLLEAPKRGSWELGSIMNYVTRSCRNRCLSVPSVQDPDIS